jgi:hypothetical protein
MFRCAICGSVSLNAGTCGVCGGIVREIRGSASLQPTGPVSPPRLRPFWTGTKIIASVIVVLVVISSVGAGLYLSARPSGPSCSDGGVNYPSCNICSPSETLTNSCDCTNKAVNAPRCNRWCANNAINPPSCDRCPDNQTDVVCPPGMPLEDFIPMSNDGFGHPRSKGAF